MKTIPLFRKKLLLSNFFKLFLAYNFFFLISQSYAQQETSNPIIKNFENYVSSYREVAYSQLNKSTYVKGETLGFCSYVIDKIQKTPSLSTKNLYCVITDQNNNVIKSKLLRTNKGITYNTFNIDSLFSTGKYTFKAYTNWMKNYNEPNAFIETFEVIDPEKTPFRERVKASDILDAQFLPEGGHFVNNVKTNVGVTIKNDNGYGVSDLEGTVYDSADNQIVSFKTNFLGIGKFSLTPKIEETYTVKINYLDKEYKYLIKEIKNKGISIRFNPSNTKVALELNTNNETLKEIKDQPFKLIIHNGNIIKEGNISFNRTNLIKVFDYNDLLPGINIFTLFDANNTPVLERLFFNYNGVNTLNLEKTNISKAGDSLQISIPITQLTKEVDDKVHLSISVLPKGTKSYQKNHNIISYTFLQPYVKGYIENAGYYFTNINRKKKYHLDNLLLTQGWSSYNWNTIFNKKTPNRFTFEKGITIKANRNTPNHSTFYISALNLHNPSIIKLQEAKNNFVVNGLFPIGNEALSLSAFDKKGTLVKPNLYVQFYPRVIPRFNHYLTSILPPKPSTYSLETEVKPFEDFQLNSNQKLDEVVIKANLRQKRLDKIRGTSFAVFDPNASIGTENLTLAQYINSYIPAFSAKEVHGILTITNLRAQNMSLTVENNEDSQQEDNRETPQINRGGSSFISPNYPLLFLDDNQTSPEFLTNFNMGQVDYIVSNPFGFGLGLRGAQGSIRIYTKKGIEYKSPIENSRKFKFPITFSKNKKFYIPKYNTYHNSFYKEYGVIDWIPNATINDSGKLQFKIHNPANTNVTLFIEGITLNGRYIASKKVLNLVEN
ncbi:hypothetical protein [Tenacibaculum aiptasiae]|uniref:hypothetical protein n=1 Tax=Tenacibaculum aiptasiae TaxID=426481 RepID=UPI003B59C8BB